MTSDVLRSAAPRRALIALGANLAFGKLSGAALLDAALARLDLEGLTVIARSSPHITQAWPDPSDPAYTNAAALVHAEGRSAQDVLALLLAIERDFGRIRTRPNAPRTLDLDLLDLAGEVIETPSLILPHPRLHERAFVLAPLCEIAPDWRHPVLGRTARELLAAL